jgi:glycosyltransferase involved in cell wall biosynthesis
MRLSVVIPVFNEAVVLPELARRARAAALQCGDDVEVILVDDASRDATRDLAVRLSDDVVRFVHLPHNRGQTGATLEGIARARGALIAVLDGDLQDPPELVAELVAALTARPDVDVAYAVKRGRAEPVATRALFAVYHALQSAFGDFPMPAGAGSYCAFRARLRDALLAAPRSRANLATLVAAQRPPCVAVPYRKERRVDGESRVGAWGLCREAIDSLAATGALGHGSRALSIGLLGAATVAAATAYERRRAPSAPQGLRAQAKP